MRLSEVLQESTIQVDLDAIDKWAAIDRLVDLLAACHAEIERNPVLDAVLDREQQGSTGLENGIAIPHARSNGVTNVVAALGISKDGMDFDSADGKPCHLVFLVVAPTSQSTKYLQVLSTIALLGGSPERLARVRGAASARDALTLLDEDGWQPTSQ